MRIVIVDLGIGNLGSVPHALRRLGVDSIVSEKMEDIRSADRLILPGVGAFDSAIRALDERDLRSELHRKVVQEGTPLLGICVGMQLLMNESEEGDLGGLGWIPGCVRRFHFDQSPTAPRVPHIGWNTVRAPADSVLFRGADDKSRFYFVHSYYVDCRDERDVAGRTEYGLVFASAVVCRNIMGVQFHPEKSHASGLNVFRNFLGR